MSTGSKAAPVFSLFRQILRLHRTKLPPPMRAMGDTYVRDEFSRHLRGNTSQEQWRVFMQEWQRYHTMLAGNADLVPDPANPKGPIPPAAPAAVSGTTVAAAASGVSGDMGEDMLSLLSPDQRARLERLREEAGRFGQGIMGGGRSVDTGGAQLEGPQPEKGAAGDGA